MNESTKGRAVRIRRNAVRPLTLALISNHDLDARLGAVLDQKEKILTDAKKRTFVGAQLEVRRDPDTERWTVSLLSRTSKEDVIVAWKQTEEDAIAWAQSYGMRK